MQKSKIFNDRQDNKNYVKQKYGGYYEGKI